LSENCTESARDETFRHHLMPIPPPSTVQYSRLPRSSIPPTPPSTKPPSRPRTRQAVQLASTGISTPLSTTHPVPQGRPRRVATSMTRAGRCPFRSVRPHSPSRARRCSNSSRAGRRASPCAPSVRVDVARRCAQHGVAIESEGRNCLWRSCPRGRMIR
jgi:hypothetical protein